MAAGGPRHYRIVRPDPASAVARTLGYTEVSEASANRLLKSLSRLDTLAFNMRREAQLGQWGGWRLLRVPSFDLYPPEGGSAFSYISFTLGSNGEFIFSGWNADPSPVDIGLELTGRFQQHIYRFAAERLKIGRGPHGANTRLVPDASNLPEVLSQLQDNRIRFDRLNRWLNLILPQVHQVSARGVGPGEVGIFVWTHDPKSERDDLAVPLSESGTGIGQVLAILYVVLTSERPQTILIDEPQSFLHPGAARKLIDFLKEYPRHQFIIATHSATVIAAANPKTITLAQLEGSESTLRQLDTEAERGIQTTLAELGIRLSDVFGADNILWVEGRTEEKCFPMIIERLLRRPLMGTQIQGIRETGDLEGRDAKRVFEIYKSLAKGPSLLPPAIAFVLDDECRDDVTKNELRSLSENRVVFLQRRMYENYLLNSRAIAEVANAIVGFRSSTVRPEEVRAAIDSKLAQPQFYCSPDRMEPPQTRIRHVDAAGVLERIFAELSETRVSYQKVRHGVALTEWLTENAPADLMEVEDILKAKLPQS